MADNKNTDKKMEHTHATHGHADHVCCGKHDHHGHHHSNIQLQTNISGDVEDAACSCGHHHNEEGHMPEEEHIHYEKTVHTQMYLETDEGEEMVCDVLGIFEMDMDAQTNEYIALLPQGQEDVLLYHYVDKDGEPELNLIESDDEFQKVSEEFMRLVELEDEA